MYHFCISITLRSDYGHLLISVLFSSVALNRGRRLLEGCTYVETRGLLKEIRYIYLAHTKNLYRTNCTFKNTFGIIFPEFIYVFCMCLGMFRYVVRNKANGISKRVSQENEARQIFRKMNISYPPRVHIRG